jgi:transitional endoplasmic reticulum ATPase
MRLEPLERRGSDFLSKWIGETERKIAQTFADAAGNGRFLIIDEVESLLWDRRGAAHSWETSMVNEFLTWLESHPLPFACTTNHIEQIDAAVLRRFTFKIRFEALKPDQLPTAFERFFGSAAPAAIRELCALTLGDFATVSRQLRYLGKDDRTPEALMSLLEGEARTRNQGGRKMGF